MSIKYKLLISAVIMLVVPAALIIILSALLVGVFTLLDPSVELSLYNGIEVSNPTVVHFIIAWAIMAILVVITTGLCIATYMSRIMLSPLRNLSEALDHMKAGELDYEFAGSGDAELQELCSSFEDLRLKLQRDVRITLQRENEQKMLLANISHDIKTPITSIKGYVEGIRDGIADTPEKQQHYLNTIYTKAEAIEQMAENLSIYSKLELGRVVYNREKTDIFAFIKKIADEFAIDLQTADMELTTDIQDGEAQVLADTEKLRRVFANIITNAIKYKKPGHGSLFIRGEITDNGALISFSDSGRGIAEEDLKRVFDGFYRGDPSRNSKIEGNGLGLSISRRIVNDHGGKIWMRSRAGEGCNVTVLLPVQ